MGLNQYSSIKTERGYHENLDSSGGKRRPLVNFEVRKISQIRAEIMKERPKRKGGYRPVPLAQIEAALRASGGFVTHAAEMIGLTQSAVSKRIAKSEHLQDVMDEIHTKHYEITVSKLMSLIDKENLGAICFYLKCKHGWTEKHNIELSGNAAAPLRIERVIIDPDAKD